MGGRETNQTEYICQSPGTAVKVPAQNLLDEFDRVKGVDKYVVVEEAAARVSAVREAVGTGVDILLDFHGRVSPAMARG